MTLEQEVIALAEREVITATQFGSITQAQYIALAAARLGEQRMQERAITECAQIYGPWDVALSPDENMRRIRAAFAAAIRALKSELP
jgi:hypothetical protein